MKKILLTALLLVCGMLHAETVKIGVILPLTGNNANMGQPQLLGLKFFEEDLAKRDTIHDYEFIVQDDELTPRKTVEATQHLINVEKVKAILSFSSGCGNAVSPLTQRAGVIHIANCASDGNVAKGSYNHTNWTRPNAQAKLFVEYAQKREVFKIAFLSMRQQGVMAIVDAAMKALEENGIESQTFDFNPNERDFRAILYKVEEFAPDLIVVESFSPCTEIIMRQYHQLGMTTPVSCIETFDYADDKSFFEGMTYVAGAAPTDAFIQRISQRFPDESYLFAPLLYDSADLLIESFEACETADVDCALEALHAIKNRPSAIGELSVDSDGVIHSPAGLYRMVEGQAVPIKMEDLKPVR